MRTWWSRLTAVFRPRQSDRELDEEIETHLAMRTAELRAQGLDPAAARGAARREFGGIDQMKELYRDRRAIPSLEILAKDLGYSLRGLRRNRAFTAAAVLSLALGIGANTAIFSFINALMLRMLPVEKPQELVNLYRTGGWGSGYAAYPLYLEFRKHTDLFSGVFARSFAEKVRFDRGHDSSVEYVEREYVTGNYFQVLGVRPVMGRLFTDGDNLAPQAHPLVVLSYDFWRTRLGLDPAILGRVLRIDEQPLTVIGVAAPGFHGVAVENHADMWAPAMMYRGEIMQPGNHWIWIMARCRPEVPRGRIQAAANTIMQQYLMSVYGGQRETAFGKWALAQRIEVRDARVGISMLREAFGKPLTILMAAVALVLLIACANVANLLIARGAARRREIAMRFSLGATRWRLVRQWLIESLLLATFGSILGLAFAMWGGRYILLFLPLGLGESFDVSPDGRVLAFTFGISVLSAVLFGLAPALRATALDPAEALKNGGTRQSGSGSRAGFRKALVVVQVAFSVVLVVAAGLFAHSLEALRAVHLGFSPERVLTFSLDYPRTWKNADKEQHRARLLARLAALPGVTAVSYGMPGPYQGGSWSSSIRVPGSLRTAHEAVEVDEQGIGPDYFRAIGVRPLRGREFSAADLRAARKVAVVNESFVREFFPGIADPLGRVLSFDDSKLEGGEPTYIVGVVHDMLHDGLKSRPKSTVYVPFHQGIVAFDPILLVRAALPPGSLLVAVRHAAATLDPEAPVVEPRTLEQRIADSIFIDRMIATLGGFFGALALLLAAIGVYGVMAYTVARRTAEIGLRIALGAATGKIEWMIMRDGLLLIALGTLVGLPLAFAAAHISASLLYGIKPGDPLVFLLTAGVLLGTGILSAFLPARRAATVQPLDALHHE
ncbi:MAG TPA: ABC transporter permease [Bryobacteraceae bacterium]|nr:ABC transporter permease [Bryobacteraceae bacterium]